MRTRITTATLTAAAILALAACTATPAEDTAADKTPAPTTPAPATPQKDKKEAAREAAGIPADPTGAARTAYLAALKAIDPSLVADVEDAIDNGVNQCSGLTGDKPEWSAQQRFGTSDRPVSEVEAKLINAAVAEYICG